MLSPDAPQVNFFANNAKVTAVAPNSSGAELGLVYPAFSPGTAAYTSITPGSNKIEAKVPASSTVMPGAVLISTTQNFDSKKYYTYVVLDSLSKLSTVVVEDDPSIPDPTKAYFRLANFVSNSAAVKIEIVKVSAGTPFSKVYPSVSFKSISAFETLEGGNGEIYKVYLRNPTTDAKLDSISAFTPSNNKKYTIYTRGVFGLTGTNAKRPIISNYVNF